MILPLFRCFSDQKLSAMGPIDNYTLRDAEGWVSARTIPFYSVNLINIFLGAIRTRGRSLEMRELRSERASGRDLLERS